MYEEIFPKQKRTKHILGILTEPDLENTSIERNNRLIYNEVANKQTKLG